jgi:hypothetical protein
MDVVVNPPREGDASYESFTKQKTQILASLAERAKLVPIYKSTFQPKSFFMDKLFTFNFGQDFIQKIYKLIAQE